MEDNITVSVVIPTYNRRGFIRQCIDSVLAQTVPVYEVIVVDDGSSDNTFECIKDLISSGKVCYHYQDNSGVSAARNKGFSLATGSHIAFLDSDDMWKPSKNEGQVAYLTKNKHIKVVHNDVELIDENEVVIEGDKIRDFSAEGFCFASVMKYCSINMSSALIARDVLVDVGTFDTRLAGSEDYELFMRISYVYEIGRINDKLSYYRLHSCSLSSNRLEILLQAVKAVDVLRSKGVLDARSSDAILRHKGFIYYRLSRRSFFELGNRRQSIVFLCQSLFFDYRLVDAYKMLFTVLFPAKVVKNTRWYASRIRGLLLRAIR